MKEELLKFAMINGIKGIILTMNNGEIWIFNIVKESIEEIEYQFYRKGTTPTTFIK